MQPQQPVDLLVKPVTKKTTKLTAQAKEKAQKKMETPPTPKTNPVLRLEIDPVPPLTKEGEEAATEAIEVAKAEAGTKEASLVDAGAEGGDKGVTNGEVKDGGVKSKVASDAAVADVTNAGNGETKTGDDGQLKVEGSGDAVTKIDLAQTPSKDALSGLKNGSPVVATTDPVMPTNDISSPAGSDLIDF